MHMILRRYGALLLGALLLLLRLRETPSPLLAIAAGVVLGVAALTDRLGPERMTRVNDQKTRRIARRHRMERDALLRQFEIENVDTHGAGRRPG